jgi:phytoene desaturase
MNQKVIIIGSGFGALGAAARLAARGYDVEIFEKRDKPGGRAYVYEQDGFKFDGGPTVVTAPFMFDDIFAAGRPPPRGLRRVHAARSRSTASSTTPAVPSTTTTTRSSSPIRFASGTRPTPTATTASWRSTKAIFQKGFVELADQPFLTVGDMLRVAPDLIRLQSHKSVYRYVSQFIDNEFLRRCFTFHPLLIGGNPFDSSSIYAMIHYLEREWGIHYVMGGTGALVNALVQLIEELGGRFHYNAEVRRDHRRRPPRHGHPPGRRHNPPRRPRHLQRRRGLDLPEHDPQPGAQRAQQRPALQKADPLQHVAGRHLLRHQEATIATRASWPTTTSS